MEVALVSSSSVRVKGKSASFIVDPTVTKTKQPADAIILLQDHTTDVVVEEARLTIAGPGEYEISGVKITGVRQGESVNYFLSLDGVNILLGKASSIKGKESLRDTDVSILLADSLADQSALTTVTNSIAIFYGTEAEANVKALGKEVQPVNKFVVTKDKLPQEMEVVLLWQT